MNRPRARAASPMPAHGPHQLHRNVARGISRPTPCQRSPEADGSCAAGIAAHPAKSSHGLHGPCAEAFRHVALLLPLLALLLQGCVARHRPAEEVEHPLRLETDRQQAGRVVFMRECQRCHPGGEAGLGPALNNKSLPRPAIAVQVRQGLGAMPAFGPDRIPDDSLGALIDYLELMRRHAGQAPEGARPAAPDESTPAPLQDPIN